MHYKQIRLRFSKIYNWAVEDELVQLDLQFYSKQSQHLISRKHIQSKTHNNYLDLDTNLKIRYTNDQNTIVVAVKKTNNHHEDLGQAQINLSELYTRKIKYLTLGKFSKILQVQLDEENDSLQQPNQQIASELKNNDKMAKFIQQRKNFLKNYIQTQNKLKNQFQQKISSLLKEQRTISKKKKIDLSSLAKNINKGSTDEFQKQIGNVKSQIKQKQIQENPRAKSTVYQNSQQLHKINNLLDNSPRKHKLILNTLNIVPNQQKIEQIDK